MKWLLCRWCGSGYFENAPACVYSPNSIHEPSQQTDRWAVTIKEAAWQELVARHA